MAAAETSGVAPRAASQEEFRILYRVGTTSWPMAGFADYKTGGNAVVLSRRQHAVVRMAPDDACERHASLVR
jgi:hypothetical protein